MLQYNKEYCFVVQLLKIKYIDFLIIQASLH